jgi:hypothetical protein
MDICVQRKPQYPYSWAFVDSENPSSCIRGHLCTEKTPVPVFMGICVQRKPQYLYSWAFVYRENPSACIHGHLCTEKTPVPTFIHGLLCTEKTPVPAFMDICVKRQRRYPYSWTFVYRKNQWWNSERFVVITRQLQAAKCSLTCQLLVTYSLYLKICHSPFCCTRCKQTFFRFVCS